MKFGGTSVGDARSIRRVVDVVRAWLPSRPVVVVSAHAGVTDLLERIAEAAPRGAADELTRAVVDRHRELLAELGLSATSLEPLLAEVEDIARGLRLVGGASAKATDRLLSYGERCSARTLALALRQAGVEATPVDAFAAGLRTDSAFGRASPEPDDGRIARAIAAVAGVPVVTGFIGADADGNVTTLGRDGSDYSAALFGAALGVAEIQLYKDVDGVRTADPRLVPAARPIRNMTYEEICELATFGSRILHPAAMVPAMARGIPILVRKTDAPEQPGTRIEADGDRRAVAAIAHRPGQALVTVTSGRPLPRHVFFARVFAELSDGGIDVGPLSVSEGAVAFAVDERMADRVRSRLEPLGDIDIVRGRALVGVVGSPDAIGRGGAATVLATLAEAGLAVRCAGQGALGGTVAVVVAEGELRDAVAALHRRFFAETGS